MIKLKLFFHIISLSLFLFGCVVLHIVLNSSNNVLVNFFNLIIGPKVFFIDWALTLVGFSFFIEFLMTFKPIKIIKGGVDVQWLKKELKKLESRVLNHIDAEQHGLRDIGEAGLKKPLETSLIPGIEEGLKRRLHLKGLVKSKSAKT